MASTTFTPHVISSHVSHSSYAHIQIVTITIKRKGHRNLRSKINNQLFSHLGWSQNVRILKSATTTNYYQLSKQMELSSTEQPAQNTTIMSIYL